MGPTPKSPASNSASRLQDAEQISPGLAKHVCICFTSGLDYILLIAKEK